MAKLQVDKSKLRMEKAEIKVGKAEIKVSQKSANRKLYEKTKPSEKLHEKVKPSAKLKLSKKGQFAAEEAMTSKKILRPKERSHLQRNLQHTPENLVRGELHREISKQEENNTGLQAIHQTEQVVEESARFTNYQIKSIRQNNKLRPFKQLEYAENKLHKAEQKLQKKTVNYRFERYKVDNKAEYSSSSPLSRWQQKQKIKKEYVKEVRLRKMKGQPISKTSSKTTSHGFKSVGQKIGDMGKTVVKAVSKDPKFFLICLGLLLIFCMISSLLSMGTVISQGVTGSTTSSSYTAEDSDILQVEANYKAKETALSTEIANIETTYPDYDEYDYYLSEIGHNPHDLAALLTALYHAYTPDMVATKLDEIFARQYSLTYTPSTETRYDSAGNPYTVDVLKVTLTNTAISVIAREFLTDEQYEHFRLLQTTKGNKPDIFGDYSGSVGGDLSYTIPSHYLTDDKFAALIAEAEKYLGYPYVWGGSTPSTSFDCSGFVCWVLKASGVWDIGRTTAQGIFNQTITIPPSERQAGDIIYFTGTYSSVGAVSHVGIYVGDGMMIHCGDPISFAPVDSGYWTSYFYAFGRIP